MFFIPQAEPIHLRKLPLKRHKFKYSGERNKGEILEYKGVEVENVYCECTDLLTSRVLLTAISERVAIQEASFLSGFSVITAAPIQACIDRLAHPSETPDGRPGVMIQFNIPASRGGENFEKEISNRLFISPHLPTCSLFNATPKSQEKFKFSVGEKLRRWGDGFEVEDEAGGREVYRVPVMTGEMLVEKSFGVCKGTDAALEIFTEDQTSSIVAMERAANRIFNEVDGAAIFCFPLGGVVGAKVGGINYKNERLTVNHLYCPTIKDEVPDTKVPNNAKSAFEFPIVGLDEDAVKKGLRGAIDAIATTPGIKKITAPSFGGRWGGRKIFLNEALRI